MQNNVLEVKNLTKEFNNFTAVDNISFSLKEGEITGFLGINGAGKTTTIQMLLGTLTPSSGEIYYFGKNLKTYRTEIMERVNYSSTYTNLPWNLTVKENLYFISYLYDIKDRKKRIVKISEMFELHELLDKQFTKLSAGQQTRVNLAKAFMSFPSILLLDEPTASLDVEIADSIRKKLLRERENYNLSILLTSHNMAEVEEICDRVIFIHRGKIIADNSPENLARSIQISHIELYIREETNKIEEYCKAKNIPNTIKGRKIIIDINEKDIATLLQDLGQHKIVYDEISIEKPTLEDYFLEKVSDK